MFEFIDIIKVLSTILITNSHYANIWPISAMAMGGLLGNVLFFAVSGFCLYEIKQSFLIWYSKRIVRIYPVLWIVNLIGLAIGFYQINSFQRFVKFFIYPTYYHFIESMMLLYIIYYVLIYLHRKTQIKIETIMFAVFLIYVFTYLFIFNKTYYHIDVVEEPMVRFLYLEGMLMGAYFKMYRKNKEENKNGVKKDFYKILICFPLYVVSKILFSRIEQLASLQIFNQIIIFVLAFLLFRMFYRWESLKKKSLDEYRFGKVIRLLAKVTLEIYLVQYLVYYCMPKLMFPINFVIVTMTIILAAMIINKIRNGLTRKVHIVLRG